MARNERQFGYSDHDLWPDGCIVFIYFGAVASMVINTCLAVGIVIHVWLAVMLFIWSQEGNL